MTAIGKKHLLTAYFFLITLAGSGLFPSRTDAVNEVNKNATGGESSCLLCHEGQEDANHDFGCVTCHRGNDGANNRETAHNGLLDKPAHPDHMTEICGGCHTKHVTEAESSLHFSLKNEINSVRALFGANELLSSPRDIPIPDKPTTAIELADDLLRRRCLRCHVYYSGDDYRNTKHGTGCAACHMQFDGGGLRSHALAARPQDNQCLSCHYGNRVGADYYGRYEHDFSWEFRTPFGSSSESNREYGVEYHQLAPDIHQIRGLSCIDCHGTELHVAPEKPQDMAVRPTCETCHNWQPDQQQPPLPNLIVDQGKPWLIAKLTGRQHPLPRPRHEAHLSDAKGVACVACHALWSFNDKGTHLLRQDTADYEPWTMLTIQSSSEVEQALERELFGSLADAPLPHAMSDKITGVSRPGLWYKGFELRRWTPVQLGRDRQGVVRVMRPALDLHLSYLDRQSVIVDSVKGLDDRHGLRPYTPHTVGKAGIYYRQRLQSVDNLQEPEAIVPQEYDDLKLPQLQR